MKLSIITVNYNDAAGLERTIKSVISQTFHDFEFIVIDGGSTDGSVDVIKRYANNIDYWVSEPDGGIYQGMNKGLRQAKGEYVNFMNGGDCFHSPNVLETIFFNNTEADIITGDHEGSTHPCIGQSGISMLDLFTGAVDHQASFIRREIALRHPYDEKYRIVSDWKFFIEALVIDNCSFTFIPIMPIRMIPMPTKSAQFRLECSRNTEMHATTIMETPDHTAKPTARLITFRLFAKKK